MQYHLISLMTSVTVEALCLTDLTDPLIADQ